MKNVLIVDDEKNIRVTLSEWFKNFVEGFQPILAEDGKEGVNALAANKVDLLITDLNMPKMDGFELLAHVSNTYPDLPTMVMTAFGTDQIKDKVTELGVIRFLDKPLDYDSLKKMDFHALVNARTAGKEKPSAGASPKSFVNGISLQSFLQLIEMEKKTCTLTITADGKKGQLFLITGDLIDAQTGEMRGEQAAYEMICWDNARIEIENDCNRREKIIECPTMHLLMEACRIKDEKLEKQAEETGVADAQTAQEMQPPPLSPEKAIAGQPKGESAGGGGVAELAAIDGFSGAILVTAEGETLQQLESHNSVLDIAQVGALANNILNTVKKSVQEIGSGGLQQIHVEAENHHILACCYENGASLESKPGKAHIHLVLLLTNGTSLEKAKMKMQAVIADMANAL